MLYGSENQKSLCILIDDTSLNLESHKIRHGVASENIVYDKAECGVHRVPVIAQCFVRDGHSLLPDDFVAFKLCFFHVFISTILDVHGVHRNDAVAVL